MFGADHRGARFRLKSRIPFVRAQSLEVAVPQTKLCGPLYGIGDDRHRPQFTNAQTVNSRARAPQVAPASAA